MMMLPAPIWPLGSTHPLRTKLFRRLHWLWCGVLHAHIMPMGPDFFKSLPFQQLFRLDRKKMARFGTWLGTDHRKRLPLRWLMAQRPEKRAQSLGNQLRLLQENEVPAAPKVDPTSDIGIDPLQIFAWGTFNLLGGECNSCRNLNAVLWSPGRRRVIPFVVEPIRGIDRLGDPVDHHIRQKLVSGEMPVQVSSWWISPYIPFLDDPRGQSCGSISESIGQRLWPRTLDVVIASLFPIPSLLVLHIGTFSFA